jgi:hypothetical protein
MITVDHIANLGDRILVLDYIRGRRKCGFLGAEDASLAVCTPVQEGGCIKPNAAVRDRRYKWKPADA